MQTKKRKKRGKPDPAILADIVKRVVRAAKPEKIVLFGSAARGEMGPDSDYDLLVIKGASTNAAVLFHLRHLEVIPELRPQPAFLLGLATHSELTDRSGSRSSRDFPFHSFTFSTHPKCRMKKPRNRNSRLGLMLRHVLA